MAVHDVNITGLQVAAAPWSTHGDPVWVSVRPNLRRVHVLAGDILAALGKTRDVSSKGRNESEDVLLAAPRPPRQRGSHQLFNSEERPRVSPNDAAQALLAYRQPYRAITHSNGAHVEGEEHPLSFLGEPGQRLASILDAAGNRDVMVLWASRK